MNAGLRNGVNSYLTVVSTLSTFYQYTAPAGSGGSFGPLLNTSMVNFPFTQVLNQSGGAADVTSTLRAGAILRDMGKSVTTNNNTSTFRKVQLLVSSGTLLSYPASSGVQGAPTSYLTGYILMASDLNPMDPLAARVARLY
jgi:hypothetical protein